MGGFADTETDGRDMKTEINRLVSTGLEFGTRGGLGGCKQRDRWIRGRVHTVFAFSSSVRTHTQARSRKMNVTYRLGYQETPSACMYGSGRRAHRRKMAKRR